jgi:hypothetical protein
LEVCENRDTKGLYKKARAGEIPEYTGISAPYEEPENPELIIETDKVTIAKGASTISVYLEKKWHHRNIKQHEIHTMQAKGIPALRITSNAEHYIPIHDRE